VPTATGEPSSVAVVVAALDAAVMVKVTEFEYFVLSANPLTEMAASAGRQRRANGIQRSAVMAGQA